VIPVKSVYLLTGMPGTGKTSLIKEITEEMGGRAGGFYTEEVRAGGVRQGFRIVALDGQTAGLAHISTRSPHRVSKYGVDIEGLERVGVTALQRAAEEADIIVIDEIGKMELLSENFKTTVLEIIESGKKALGTIMLKSDPWVDMIKKKPQVQIITLNRNNRQEVRDKIMEWIKG